MFSGGPGGPDLSLRLIVVPDVNRRNGQPHADVSVVQPDARVAAQGGVGKLELVALAQQVAERAVALTGGAGRLGEAALEQRDGGLEVVVVALRERRRHVLARDAEGADPALDTRRAAAVEVAAILREAPRVRRVVHVAAGAQLLQDLPGEPGIHPSLQEGLLELVLGPVAPAQSAPGDVEGPLALVGLGTRREARAVRAGHGGPAR